MLKTSFLRYALPLLGGLAFGQVAFAEMYELDTAHTNIGFSVRHLVISNSRGNFKTFQGKAEYDEKKQQLIRVSASIDAASIDTDNEKRDEHLRSADFFDVVKYPKITFESTSIKKMANDDYEVVGKLMIHGVTKEVTLKGKMLGSTDSKDFGKRIGFTASAVIMRKDFGLTWNKLLEAGKLAVGEEVTLTIDAEILRK